MSRTPRLLEKVDYLQYNLNIPLTLPGNGKEQTKGGLVFDVKDRDVILDWYNAYFRMEYELQVKANGNFVAANVMPAPVNGSFSQNRDFKVKSAGKPLYRPTAFTKSFSSKRRWNSPTTTRGVWQKMSFGSSTAPTQL